MKRSIKSIKRFVSFEELQSLSDDEELLVSRISINALYAFAELGKFKNKEKIELIDMAHKRLRIADDINYENGHNRPIWGITLTAKDVKIIFDDPELYSETSIRKQKNEIKSL